MEKYRGNDRTTLFLEAACGWKMTSLIDDMQTARAHHGTADDAPFVIAAMYKFIDLDDHRALQQTLQTLCDAHQIQGTILLAEEGVNGTICGSEPGMIALLRWLQEDARFDGMSLKFSFAPAQAFLRMKVRLKNEIVTMGRPEIRPSGRPAPDPAGQRRAARPRGVPARPHPSAPPALDPKSARARPRR